MLPLMLGLCACAGDPAPGHEANPLYQSLLDPGLAVGPKERAKLPAPSMSDGLDAAKQTAVINQIITGDYSYEEFTRRSVVAPQVIRITDVEPSDSKRPEPKPSDPKAFVRRVDVWFVAYGDFKATEDEKFLDRLVNTTRGEGKGHGLTKEELAKRGITIPPDREKTESYGAIEFDFLEKVRLRATGRAVWSRSPESALAAAEIDPRFQNDPEYPNDWRSITKEGGQVKLGPPHPWSGAGFYLKVTKLAEPAGALFIEQHIVFAEPTGWFEGANLLRSKLPPAVQNNVRTMRREWIKTVQK